MKKAPTRYAWLSQDPGIRDWLAAAVFPTAKDDHSLLMQLNQVTDEAFRKIKQRWSTHHHRSKRKSISCDISPISFQKFKSLQGNKSLTKTLEELIDLNYEARNHYKKLADEKISQIKTKRDLGISREINKLSDALSVKSDVQKELAELKRKLEESDEKLEAHRAITFILLNELTSIGHSISEDNKASLAENLKILEAVTKNPEPQTNN
ncbi:hypothetical protein [Pseudomonas nitroreducens]|uniref:hypothetical protein n=1 Tax=Pseudomonas nitroreducens TaxID=46680 RepID=UPI002FDF7A3F